MNILFLGVIIFVLSLFVIELITYALRVIQHPDSAEIHKRLRGNVLDESLSEQEDIIKKRSVLSDVPFLDRILHYLPWADRLALLIKQANLKLTVGFLCLSGMALGLMTYLLCFALSGNRILSLLLAPASAYLPFFYVRSKKKKRMAKFEAQLPEGLELIARALRAGHAFTSGMKLSSDEFGDPLGPEFADTLDEINFGLSVADALKNLAIRVDCPDLKFFVVSVILQRETGGNLAEIIEKLAFLIRERFKFRGKVRVLSAEGRFSAIILLVIPFVVSLILYFANQKYIVVLFLDPIGKVMLGIAALMMVMGIYMIRRIIKVEV